MYHNMEIEYNYIWDIVFAFTWVCDILLFTANVYSVSGHMILKSTASREYPRGSDTKPLFFQLFFFPINSNEAKLYYETFQHIADIITEAPNLFYFLLGFLKNQLISTYSLGHCLWHIFPQDCFLLNSNY